jgi:hypothetical protein
MCFIPYELSNGPAGLDTQSSISVFFSPSSPCARKVQLRIMKLAQILTSTWFSTSISGLLFSNSSIERNVSITHHAGLPVDNLKFSAETVGSKSPPGPDVVQIAGSTWDPKNFATPEAWEKYAGKGGWLNCLFAMSDEEAGAAWPDPLGRTPKSASSQWVGTLEGKYVDMEDILQCFS